MEEAKLTAALEAALFVTGKAIPMSELAKAVETDTKTVEAALLQMQSAYAEGERGIRLIRLENSWQMCTDPSFYDMLIRLELSPRKPSLTDVLLETLSVIAYKQPVTKAEIERIRGVNSDHAVNRLVEFGLVKELGRAKLPGRPVLFGTTEEFLRCFGVSSTEDLPEISAVKLEDFRAEAESEAAVEVGV